MVAIEMAAIDAYSDLIDRSEHANVNCSVVPLGSSDVLTANVDVSDQLLLDPDTSVGNNPVGFVKEISETFTLLFTDHEQDPGAAIFADPTMNKFEESVVEILVTPAADEETMLTTGAVGVSTVNITDTLLWRLLASNTSTTSDDVESTDDAEAMPVRMLVETVTFDSDNGQVVLYTGNTREHDHAY